MNFKLPISLKFFYLGLLLIAVGIETNAQFIEAGINAGFAGTRYTVSSNALQKNVWIRQGKVKFTPRFGSQILLRGVPDKYNIYNKSIKHGLMAELSACRCGGETEILVQNIDGSQNVTVLDYRTWQGDFSLLYQLKINKTQIIMGPSFTYHTYRAVSDGRKQQAEYVYTQGQINEFYVGFDLGLGYRVKNLLISSRYHTAVTPYGEKTNAVPVVYGLHQARIMLSYFFYKKRFKNSIRGLYF